MQKLFNDQIILHPNTSSLEAALAFARDFRSCARTILVGPNFFLANGANGCRCFYEMGVSDIVLDLRLIGSPRELWQCISSAAQLGVKGITLSAMGGKANITNAINAADASKAQAGKIQRPRILLSPLPPHIGDAEMIDDLGMRVRRKEHIRRTAQLATETGADGLLLDYEDMAEVRKVNKSLSQIVFAQKKPYNPYEVEPAATRKLPSIDNIIRAKASHVIFDSQLITNTDREWCAELLTKELTYATQKKEIGNETRR